MDTVNKIPIDRGWAWVVLFANIFMNLIIGGVLKSFGIFFSSLQERFDTSSTHIASLPSIMLSTMFFTGIVSTRLADRYTSRVVVSVGSILIFLGYVLSALAPTANLLFITYGGLMGVGLGCIYAPSVVVLNYYFREKRALAHGLSAAGSGMGSMSYPPLLRLSLDYYSLVATLALLGAWVLNLSLCACLMRPPAFYDRSVHPKEKKIAKLGKTTKEEVGFEWKIVEDPVLWIYSICAALCFGFYVNMYVMIAPYVEQTGKTKEQASFIVSMIGACDILSRVIFGYIADFNWIPKRYIYQGTVCISAVLMSIVPEVVSRTGNDWFGTCAIALITALATSSAGLTMSLNPTIFSETFGPRRLSNTFGFMTLMFGFILLFVSTGMGKLCDITGSWVTSFHASSLAMGLVFLLLCGVPRALRSRGHRALELHQPGVADVVMTLVVEKE